MLTGERLGFVSHSSNVQGVGEQRVQLGLVES